MIQHLLFDLAEAVSTRTNDHSNEANLWMIILWNIDSFVEPDYRSPVTDTKGIQLFISHRCVNYFTPSLFN